MKASQRPTTIRILVACTMLLVSASQTAFAQTRLDDARAAWEREDYATAAQLLQSIALQDDPRAQFLLGALYKLGQGVPQDYAEAVRWYRLAAEQGYAAAQAELGFMYVEGHGVPQDFAQAVQWLRRAAEQGHSDAQRSLGSLYHTGQGVPQDYVETHKWANLAAARFSASEKEMRDMAVSLRELIAERMTPAQIAEAQRLAREWQPRP